MFQLLVSHESFFNCHPTLSIGALVLSTGDEPPKLLMYGFIALIVAVSLIDNYVQQLKGELDEAAENALSTMKPVGYRVDRWTELSNPHSITILCSIQNPSDIRMSVSITAYLQARGAQEYSDKFTCEDVVIEPSSNCTIELKVPFYDRRGVVTTDILRSGSHFNLHGMAEITMKKHFMLFKVYEKVNCVF